MSRDILFLSTNRYHDFPSRKTRFSKFLSENGFRVVYVESPHTYLAYLKNFKFEKRGKIEEIAQNYYVLKSFPILPFFKKYKLFNSIDAKIYFETISNALKEISFNPSVIFTYMPFFPQILKDFKGKLIYDCVDDHASFGGLINPDFVNYLEKETVNTVDKVIVTSNKTLSEKIKSYGTNPIIVPNGVDYDLFSSWINIKDRLKIKKQITYVGAIPNWFDIDLVEYIANSLKDYEVILIGFSSIQLDTLLKRNENIKFLGKMSQKEFAPILWESSVAIIPFKVNELTKKIDPLKVYEYLASGVPVVSTPVGDLKDLPVSLASSKEEFVSKIKYEIENDSLINRLKRSEFAKQFSWENQSKKILEIVNGLLENG